MFLSQTFSILIKQLVKKGGALNSYLTKNLKREYQRWQISTIKGFDIGQGQKTT